MERREFLQGTATGAVLAAALSIPIHTTAFVLVVPMVALAVMDA